MQIISNCFLLNRYVNSERLTILSLLIKYVISWNSSWKYLSQLVIFGTHLYYKL